jgi:type IV pilus assembly protein PilA
MLARLRTSQEDEGFTLIELLVVIIIIGILAAIAIPTFLNQRKKGWKSAIKSDLHNAAIAEESYATDNDGQYLTATGSGITGFNPTNNVTIVATASGTSGYTLVGNHQSLTNCTLTFSSTTGTTTSSGTGC